MSEPNGLTSAARAPVFVHGKRVSGLYERTRADGSVVYEFNARLDGKMMRRKLKARSKVDAANEVGALRVDVKRGELKLGDRSLTIEGLLQSFLERERGPLAMLSPRTVDLYEQRLRSHVLPALGRRTKADDVTVQHVRNLLDHLKLKRRPDGKPLSGSTVRGTLCAASAMFRHGVTKLRTPGTNPFRELEHSERPSATRQTDPRYLSPAEVGRLLGELSDEMRPIAGTCFWGGLRVSEALALRWEDIDLAAAVMAVRGTKTAAAERTIPILAALGRELQAHRQRQAARGFERVRADQLVFLTRAGVRAPNRRNVLRAVSNAGRRAGLQQEGEQPIGVHDLRHSLVANAFEHLHENEIALLVGHANPAVTRAVYGGVVKSDAVSRIGERFAQGGFGA